MEHLPGIAVCVVLLASLAAPLSSTGQTCADCHADVTADGTAHAAVAMGCESCHSAIDSSEVPHKKTNALERGLSAGQPDLCYGCHDRAAFEKPHVHAAVLMGCTSCHDPHASRNAKLLSSPLSQICHACHDKAAFMKKTVHPPVAAGECTTCHVPHASDNERLLTAPAPDLCLMCHESMNSGKHVMAGHGSGDHPLAGKQDPTAPGREISCASCHRPHASDHANLFPAVRGYPPNLCLTCHRKISVR